MPSKTAKSSTASTKPRGKGSQDVSEGDLDVPPKETNSNGQEEAPPTTGK